MFPNGKYGFFFEELLLVYFKIHTILEGFQKLSFIPGHSEVIVNSNDDRANLMPTFTKYEGRGAVLQCRSGYVLGDDNTCQGECYLKILRAEVKKTSEF